MKKTILVIGTYDTKNDELSFISKKIVETSLRNKIHVITPNKALISKHGNALAKIAEQNNVNLEFEASVAGGIPILRSIKEGLATNKISKVSSLYLATNK